MEYECWLSLKTSVIHTGGMNTMIRTHSTFANVVP